MTKNDNTEYTFRSLVQYGCGNHREEGLLGSWNMTLVARNSLFCVKNFTETKDEDDTTVVVKCLDKQSPAFKIILCDGELRIPKEVSDN